MSGAGFVSADSRYEGALAEISERLAIRIQIQLTHFVSIAGLTAAYITSLTAGSFGPLFQAILALSLPYVSMYFISLYARNDERIGIACAFCAALEISSEQVRDGAVLPRWFGGGAESGQDTWIVNRDSENAAKWGVDSTIFLTLASPILLFAYPFFLLASGDFTFREILPHLWMVLPAILIWRPIKVNIKRMHWVHWYRYRFAPNVKYDFEKRVIISPNLTHDFDPKQWRRDAWRQFLSTVPFLRR